MNDVLAWQGNVPIDFGSLRIAANLSPGARCIRYLIV